MDTKTLREFVVLSTSHSFHEAASKLFISQPALSNHIAALEKEIGSTIVDRTSPISLTENGKLFLYTARKVLGLIDNTIQVIQENVKAEQSKKIRIFMPQPSKGLLALLERLDSQDIRFVSQNINPHHIFAPLDNNEVDIMFCTDLSLTKELRDQVEANNYSFIEGPKLPLCLVVEKESPLGELADKKIRKADLKGLRLALVGAGSMGHWMETVENVLGSDLDLEFSYCPFVIPNSIAGIKLENMGLLAVLEIAKTSLGDRDDLVIIEDIEGVDLFQRNSLVYRRGNKRIDDFVAEFDALVNAAARTDT